MLAIETERLLLRRWQSADAPALAALHGDPEVMTWLGSAPLSREQSDACLDRWDAEFEAEGLGLWAVERRSDGALVGMAGLHRVLGPAHPMTPSTEIAWRQARWAWGNGYIAEAARAALRDGFDRLGLDEIRAWTAAPNVRSQAVMQRLSMTRAPALDFETPALPEGHRLRPHVVYRALRGSWPGE